MSTPRRPQRGRSRSAANVKTNSGKSINVNQSISDRWKSKKFSRQTRKAEYLSTLPKEPWKRILYRLHPKRVFKYWFSREGLIMGLKLVGIGFVCMFILVVSLFAYYRKDLPNLKDISGSKIGGSNTYYDSTGQTLLWQDYNATKRIGVQGDQISNYMKQATVAIEDKDFYNHGAFDTRGILRAGVNDVFGGGPVQGGSTLTQQLVKNENVWTYDRSITRKLKEIIIAVELERDYSKQEILTGYLNVAPYGNVDRGVEAASRDYFGKSAKDLTLAESAMLASIPQAPTSYSPYSSPRFNQAATADLFHQDDLIGRQHYVLDQMAKQKMITQAQADEAKKVDVIASVKPLQNKYEGIKAPYFVQAAKQELQNKLGAAAADLGGLKVTTTVDMNLQTKAEQLVATNAASVRRLTANLADDQAVVLEDVQTGQIKAQVGGENSSDYATADNGYAQLNFATRKISPGSTFKPYDYVTMIDNNNNVGASSVIYDNDTKLPANGYECTVKYVNKDNPGNCLKDYDFLQPGAVTIRYALGGSRNVPAVKAMLSAVPNDTSTEKVKSVQKVIDTASAMMANPYLKGDQRSYNCYRSGLEEVDNATDADRVQCGASSAIGDGAYLSLDDHVNGIATLARLGNAIPKTYLLNVTNSANKSIYKWSQPKVNQVVKQDSAYIVNDMASDWKASYLPGSCSDTNCTGYKFHRYQGWKFAIKTGTTNFGFDGLMASWSSKYAVISWVGNHTRNVDITSKTRTSMEYLTEPLTKGLMTAAHDGQKPVDWVKPADIKTAPGFVQRAHIHYGDVQPGPTNDLYPSWYVGNNAVKQAPATVVDKVSGKVATSCTPALAKDSGQTNSNAATWNADIFTGGIANVTDANKSKTGTSTVAQATDDVHNCNDSPPTVTVTAPSTCAATENGGQGCQIVVVASQGTAALSGGSYTAAPAGSIAVTVNGQNVSNQQIPADSGSPYQYSFYYKPGSNGGVTFTATVIDSVLYSGTGTSGTVDGNSSTAPPLGNVSVNSAAGSTLVSWAGGTAPYSVSRDGNPVATCQNTQANSCLVPGAPANHKFTVTDSSSPPQTAGN